MLTPDLIWDYLHTHGLQSNHDLCVALKIRDCDVRALDAALQKLRRAGRAHPLRHQGRQVWSAVALRPCDHCQGTGFVPAE